MKHTLPKTILWKAVTSTEIIQFLRRKELKKKSFSKALSNLWPHLQLHCELKKILKLSNIITAEENSLWICVYTWFFLDSFKPFRTCYCRTQCNCRYRLLWLQKLLLHFSGFFSLDLCDRGSYYTNTFLYQSQSLIQLLEYGFFS